MTTTGRYALPCIEGTRVAYSRDGREGEGVFIRCWLGIEECWDVRVAGGATVHLYPCFGDTMTPLDP